MRLTLRRLSLAAGTVLTIAGPVAFAYPPVQKQPRPGVASAAHR
jgi:hypothetical protein